MKYILKRSKNLCQNINHPIHFQGNKKSKNIDFALLTVIL